MQINSEAGFFVGGGGVKSSWFSGGECVFGFVGDGKGGVLCV